jgi:Zn-finger nucleic acid-binding protein
MSHLKKKKPCVYDDTFPDIQNNPENIQNNPDLIQNMIKMVEDSLNTNEIIDNTCPHCKKKFFHKGNVNKHIEKKNCKVIKNKEKIDDRAKEMLKEMMENHFKSNINTNINTTNNNITNNNTTNNINNTQNIQVNIFSVGKEDLSRLSEEDILKICTSGTYYPIVAAQVIHCNKNYPEFQNFLISNLRSNTGLVYANDTWVSKSQDEILTNLMRIDKKHVSNLIKDIKVDDKLKVKLESTRDEIDTNEVKEHQKPKIREALYNASKMIGKNKKVKEKVTIENTSV